jgi:hypothetical protein
MDPTDPDSYPDQQHCFVLQERVFTTIDQLGELNFPATNHTKQTILTGILACADPDPQYCFVLQERVLTTTDQLGELNHRVHRCFLAYGTFSNEGKIIPGW